MDPTKSFDPYEVIGIITPGTLVALLLAAEAPLFRSLLGSNGLTVGDFGLFLLLAFVFGHLIQALGNLIEAVVWPRSGLPTDTVRADTQALISPAQRTRLVERITAMEGQPVDLATVAPAAWRAMTARAYARVSAAGRSGRIDIFNRTYGLCRGLVAATTLTLGWCLYAHHDQPLLVIILALMAVAAVMRMRRAGKHYARALFQAFIDLDASAPPVPTVV